MKRSLNAEKIASREVPAWTTALSLAADIPWTGNKRGKYTHAKSVTWPDYDQHRMRLTVLANRKGILRKLKPEMLVIGQTASAPDSETDLYQHSQYYIVRTGLYRVVQEQTKLASEITPEEKEERDEGIKLATASPLTLPNNEDRAELARILYIGFMDGVRPDANL